MVYSLEWDETFPPDTSLARLLGQDIREFKRDIRERVSSFGAGLLADRPTPEASWVGVTYIATDTNKYFLWSGTAWLDITSVIQAMAPSSSIPIPDSVRVYHNAAQSIISAIWTPLTFNSERYDNNLMHDAGQPTRLVCKTAGKHLIIGNVQFDPSATGYRNLGIRLNQTGSASLGHIALINAVGNSIIAIDMSVSTIYNLIVGDYVELTVFHTVGAPLNVNSSSGLGNGNFSPEFMMTWLGP